MSQRKIEMTWTCSACETQNLGRHKVCQSCGDPKDPGEKFEMPSNTGQAATVRDPELLKLARAGKDWHCPHCGSNVSATLDACTQCGANRQGRRPPPMQIPELPDDPPPPQGAPVGVILLGLVGLVVLVFVVGLVSSWWSQRPRELEVRKLDWQTSVQVERYSLFNREGFQENRPADALEVQNQGPRHHHDEQVLDHYETEHYTEKVQDGYEQESYQERVSCGEDCVDVPETCSEHCSDDGNGFATCTETCTGGGQRCKTRYCNETRYRQVPKYRDEPRTRKVPKYRSEPRDADWFTWKVWDWANNRKLEHKGSDLPVVWPTEAEIALKAGLTQPEDERETRSGTFKALLSDGSESWWIEVQSDKALEEFPLGSEHKARIVEGKVQLLDGDGATSP